MRTKNEAKFKGAQMISKKENLERSEMKREKTLCRHGGNPSDQQYEKPNLE